VSDENKVIPETISFSYTSFLKLLESLVNNFGSAGESMIFQIGRDFGVHYCQDVLTKLQSDEMELREMFDYVIQTASKDGWANMELDEFNPQSGSIHVILKQNVFKPKCTMLHSPQCFFLRGYISGIIKELTNMDYMFFSSQCYAHGDEHCSIKLIAQVR
jgi:predicted hydrocarbon binding protein